MRASWMLALLLTLAACQRSGQKVIAVIPKATSHLFWVAVENGARAAAAEAKVEMLWNGPPSETDYARQIQILDSMIARRVDGIVVAATERKALVAPIERAMAAGIPVTVFDSGIDGDNYTSFVATNNYEGGAIAARELGQLTGGEGKAALLMNAPGSTSTMDRERGFEETLAKEFPKLTIVARQYGQSDRGKARAAAENMLTAHPDLKGMFCSSEPSAVGAALAVKARQLSGKLALVTFDSSADLVEDLKGGTISAMVVQDPFRMGHDAVQSIVDKLAGKAVAKRVDLSAKLVRRDDLAKPDVIRLLTPEKK
ncbi:MAG: substrate-binding domain-containing protein [Bryobacteraceae bacterium]|nr:substrate-binding domain-containing protein [Bryobacteraceae bacterium]